MAGADHSVHLAVMALLSRLIEGREAICRVKAAQDFRRPNKADRACPMARAPRADLRRPASGGCPHSTRWVLRQSADPQAPVPRRTVGLEAWALGRIASLEAWALGRIADLEAWALDRNAGLDSGEAARDFADRVLLPSSSRIAWSDSSSFQPNRRSRFC